MHNQTRLPVLQVEERPVRDHRDVSLLNERGRAAANGAVLTPRAGVHWWFLLA